MQRYAWVRGLRYNKSMNKLHLFESWKQPSSLVTSAKKKCLNAAGKMYLNALPLWRTVVVRTLWVDSTDNTKPTPTLLKKCVELAWGIWLESSLTELNLLLIERSDLKELRYNNSMIKDEEAVKELEKFKKEFNKLMSKYPYIVVGNDIRERLIAYRLTETSVKQVLLS